MSNVPALWSRDMVQPVRLPTQLWVPRGGLVRPRPEKMEPIDDAEGVIGKPGGGMWTSTWATAFEEGYPWWAIQELFANMERYGWLLEPRPCRVFTVATPHDAQEIHARFGASYYELHGLPEPPDGIGLMHTVAWERVAEHYDAVRLTGNAACHWDIRHSEFMTFYTWDFESTLWFRWLFDDVRRVSLRPYVPNHENKIKYHRRKMREFRRRLREDPESVYRPMREAIEVLEENTVLEGEIVE